MADYYPVLAKAVAGLPDSTAESRHAIYERARGALFGQLRSLDPPVPEEAIEREAQALEVAVARLETEIASRPDTGSGAPMAEPDLADLRPTAGSPAGASLANAPSAAPPLPEPNPLNPVSTRPRSIRAGSTSSRATAAAFATPQSSARSAAAREPGRPAGRRAAVRPGFQPYAVDAAFGPQPGSGGADNGEALGCAGRASSPGNRHRFSRPNCFGRVRLRYICPGTGLPGGFCPGSARR